MKKLQFVVSEYTCIFTVRISELVFVVAAPRENTRLELSSSEFIINVVNNQ